MSGLLDWIKTPEGQGLLGGLAGYAANAQRGAPINSLGRGGLAGLLAYSNAGNMDLKRQEEAQQRQLRDMQLTKARTEMADDQWMRDNAPKFFTPGAPAMGQLDGALPSQFQTGAVPMPAQAPKFDVQGFAQARMAQNPLKGMEMLQALQKDTPFNKVDLDKFTPESLQKFGQTRNYGDLVPQANVQIAPNGVAYDPRRTQPGAVFSDPNKPFSVAGPNEAFQQFDIRRAAAGAARNSNTVINKQETEEGKTVGKFFGENYAKVQESGMNAQGAMNRLNRLGGLLEGVDTGKFAPLGLEAAKTAESLGFKIDPKLANKEAAVALSSEIALQLRNPAGGAGMPGAMSDADRAFLAGMVPGIEKTPDGRKLILDTAKKMAQRDIKVAEMARQYRAKNGSINEGFYDELTRFSEANPLFKTAPAAAAPAAAASRPTMRWNPATGKVEPI